MVLNQKSYYYSIKRIEMTENKIVLAFEQSLIDLSLFML